MSSKSVAKQPAKAAPPSGSQGPVAPTPTPMPADRKTQSVDDKDLSDAESEVLEIEVSLSENGQVLHNGVPRDTFWTLWEKQARQAEKKEGAKKTQGAKRT